MWNSILGHYACVRVRVSVMDFVMVHLSEKLLHHTNVADLALLAGLTPCHAYSTTKAANNLP